jgi:trk system potassium uptake protein TrkA
MNFIVVGCGRVGAELAYRRTLEGEGLAETILERAGVKEADGLAAVTNSDSLNAVVAHTARTFYHVPMVVVRNYDPGLRVVIEAFGLQTVSSTSWGAQRVEELLMNPIQHMVYSAGNGEVEVYEVLVSEAWGGHKLGEILEPLKECCPVAITRAGRSFLPDADVILQTGDVLNVSSTSDGISALTARLAKKMEA